MHYQYDLTASMTLLVCVCELKQQQFSVNGRIGNDAMGFKTSYDSPIGHAGVQSLASVKLVTVRLTQRLFLCTCLLHLKSLQSHVETRDILFLGTPSLTQYKKWGIPVSHVETCEQVSGLNHNRFSQ